MQEVACHKFQTSLTAVRLPGKIKVLCEKTRELTHDFLDYV